MIIFNNYSSMPEMAGCTLCSGPDSFNITLEECIESLIGALFIFLPVALNECLQLGEKLLYGIEIR